MTLPSWLLRYLYRKPCQSMCSNPRCICGCLRAATWKGE